MWVDAEAFELQTSCAAAGAEVDPAVADQIEYRGGLGTPHRVVVRLGHEPHAVTEADALGAARDRAVEHLGIRAVRVLLEEVVLDRPEGMPTHPFREDRLLECVLVRGTLLLLREGPRHRDLVEQGELHSVAPVVITARERAR
jgi:hypothetical protein